MRRTRRHPLLRATGLGLVAALSFGVTGAVTGYTRLQNNIESADVAHLLGEDRPVELHTPDPDDPDQGRPVNILVMGNDAREGNEDVASDATTGQRSDTTILVHISADRERVDLVSIPRDSLVDIPACERSDGTTSNPRSDEMFNSAFAIGSESGEVSDAAACTVRTVEQETGVFIHHFVVVDMSGFVEMIDAVGGVPMCIPQDMYSRKARLDLEAGSQVLDGRTALAFARARTGEGLGDGSDTGRIGRQQELIAATARTVLSKNLLTDVPELVRFLNAATRSLTVSRELAAIPDMAGLGFSLRGISSGSITLMTIPNAPAPSDPNRLVWTDEADDVWVNIAADRPLVPEVVPTPEPTATAEPGTGPTAEPTTEPEPPAEPEPVETEEPEPGQPFTPDDIATVCG